MSRRWKEIRIDVHKPVRELISVRLPSDLLDKIEAHCIEHGISLTQFIESAAETFTEMGE